MATIEKLGQWVELMTVGFIAIASFFLWPLVTTGLTLGQSVLYLMALLLAQGLARDVAILLRKRVAVSHAAPREMQCVCLESAVGIAGVVMGIVLMGLTSTERIFPGPLVFASAIAGTLVAGFLIKDLIITWNPLGVRREKNHLSVVVRWTRNSI